MRTHCFHILTVAAALSLLCACTRSVPETSRKTGSQAEIFPDYASVTIPPNVAPLDFIVRDSVPLRLEISAGGAARHIVLDSGKDGFRIPLRRWRSLLGSSAGKELTFRIFRKAPEGWEEYEPFKVAVSEDAADGYLAYRLIAPGYGLWNKMGLYQRDLSSFRQSVIYENSLTKNNCVNCHSFPSGDPDRMVFHLRSHFGGTVYRDGDLLEKLNTKTDSTISALVYPYWHPSGELIAFSVNRTSQAFHAWDPNRIEVYDSASDVVVYEPSSHRVFSTDKLKSPSAFETFPTFSPDGRSLYFCTAPAVEPMPERYKEVHYSLCRIDFNPDDRSFGDRVDTLFCAGDSLSASFPRVSPDGKHLVFTRHGYGNFSIWHSDADLWIIDLASGEARPLGPANSDRTDSYHSWSGNSRWMVFSSRRTDGLYTRLYLVHIAPDGTPSKPFLLPQRAPQRYYSDLMYSYNIPEFISGKVSLDRHKVARMMRKDAGENLSYGF